MALNAEAQAQIDNQKPTEHAVTTSRTQEVNPYRRVEAGGTAPKTQEELERDNKIADVREEYKTFLTNHLVYLKKQLENDKEFLNNPESAVDRMLMDKLMSRRHDNPGEYADINTAELDKFLAGDPKKPNEKNPSWEIVNELYSQELARLVFVAGQALYSSEEGERLAQVEEQQIRTGKGQSKLNELAHKLGPYLGKNGQRIFGATAAAACGAVYGLRAAIPSCNPAVMAGGAVVGAAAGVGMAAVFEQLQKGGITISFRQCAATFNVIKEDPREADYMKKVYGIDVNDWQVNGNRIERVAYRTPETTYPLNEIVKKTTDMADIRKKYYGGVMGIPENRVDMLPEGYLYRGRDLGPEQLGSSMQNEIQELFNPNRGGIQDGNGNPIEVRIGGNWVQNPAYRPDLHGYDITGNIQRYWQARRNATLRVTERYITEQLGNHDRRDISLLEEKKKDRGPDGKVRTERKKLIKNEITRMNGDIGVLQADEAKLTQYKSLREGRNLAYEMVKRAGYRDASGNADLTALNTKIQEITDKIELETDPDSIASRMKVQSDAMLERQAKVQKDMLTANPKTDQGIIRDAAQGVATYYEQFIFPALRAKEASLRAELKKLTDLRQGVDNSEGALMADTEGMMDATEIEKTISRDYEKIKSWNRASAPLTITEIATSTVDELMRRVNIVNAADATKGWPINLNNEQANRDTIERAIIEARSRMAEMLDPAHVIRKPAYTEIINLNVVTDSQLSLWNEANLIKIINTVRSPQLDPTSAADMTKLRNAIAEAKNRLEVREAKYSGRLKELDMSLRQKQDQEKRVDAEVDAEVKRLDLAEAAKINQENASLHVIEVIRAKKAEFTDTNHLKKSDSTYTKAERDAKYAKGYYEFMDLLFDYKDLSNEKLKFLKEGDNPMDRSERFERIREILPPKKLAEILNTTLGLGLGPPPAPALSFENALTVMDTRIGNGRIGSDNLRTVIISVVNRVFDEAKVI